MLITKYFSESVLKFVEKGCFRFGTLTSYGGGKLPGARFSDLGEGKSNLIARAASKAPQVYERISFPGVTFTNFTVIDCGAVFESEVLFNDLVFCATFGGYDRVHHIGMRDGAVQESGLAYLGNEELTHFAEIDVGKFVEGITLEAPNLKNWTAGGVMRENFFHARVVYGKRNQEFVLSGNYDHSTDRNPNDYHRTIFTKPENFRFEQEIRFVLRPDFPNCLNASAEAEFIESKVLQSSIVRIGSL